ncbi:hypothetical protein TWF569_010727 [Orbilia oligospora]|uniref:SAP domain-containing protein n=1 Tax=Orbilia oligospora TaxID=2813651 RepID=A0A7C8J968_ORBOL|nr:hypothetical protein TWF102_003717 [Orbilia oligospora]KAF3105225.1 hypothetical protein TWF103_006686 [Orbilia oligospora]KAF3106156.1 hypothetical protein TWF706_003538 [Orbilia oligospora]KAF3133030.1 hypothetical protein TWF569_010727 [Orbilia oligospora]KAF3152395.1 hypothetical protein TWF594_004085 [Orbilia oligospora]
MDPSTLKVTELKAELKKRGLAVGGLKKDLVERLTEAIERENAEAAEPEEEEEEEEEAEEEEEEATGGDGEEEQAEPAVVEEKPEEETVEEKTDEQDEASADAPQEAGEEEPAEEVTEQVTKEDDKPEEPEKVEEPEKMEEDTKPEKENKQDPDTSGSTEQTTAFDSTLLADKLTANSLEDVEMTTTEETKQPEAAAEDKMEVEEADQKPAESTILTHAPTVETAAATPIPAQEEPKQPENVLEPITSAPTPLQPPEAVQSIEADLSNRRKRSRSPSVRVDEVEAKKARIHEEVIGKDEVAMADAPVISTASPERGRKSPRDRSRSRTRSRSRSRTESPSQSRQRPSIVASTKDARFKSLFNKEEASAANQGNTGAATPPRSEDEEETSPSIHPATRGLYIRELVRPLQESQLKTHLIQLASKSTDPSNADPSTLESIYLDGIKTHCFAVFSTVQACSRARNGMHGKIFPNERNRRVLFADYVPEDKVGAWVAREKENRGVRFVITYGDGEDGVEAVHEEFSSGNGGNGGRGSIGGASGGNRLGSGAPPIDAPAGPRGRSSFSNNGPAGNNFITGANSVPQGARVVSLDELFSSTKTKPKVYFKPVDAATVKERIARGPVEGEVRGRRVGGRGGGDAGPGPGPGNSDSWRGGFGGAGRGGRGGRRGGGDSWTNKDRERDREFERRDWVRDGGRGDRRGPFRDRSPRDRR